MIELRILGSVELEGGRDPDSILKHPRELSILAYLVVQGAAGRPCTRDELLALFWPESDERRARNALNQALHRIRRGTDDRVFASRAAHELGLDSSRIASDVSRFQQAMAAGMHEAALAVYRGSLLDGFHLPNDGAFERWLDGERNRLRAAARDSSRVLRDAAAEAGDDGSALHWARHAVDLSGREERDVCRVIELLSLTGDRVAALRAYEEFERWLASELDLTPAPETRALVASIQTVDPPTAALPAPGFAPAGDDGRSSRDVRTTDGQTEAGEDFYTLDSELAAAGMAAGNRRRWRAPTAWVLVGGSALLLLGALTTLPIRKGSAGEGIPSEVPEPAYAFYERGRQYVLAGLDGSNDERRVNWTRALEMFENAVEIAPGFALAHAELGMAHLRLFHWGFDRSTERQVRSRTAIDRSLELDPDLPEAHKALGYYYQWGERDYERAREAGLRAEQGLPDDTDVIALVLSANRRLGRVAEAASQIERLVQLEPQSVFWRRELVTTYIGTRDYPRAFAVLEESLALFPTDPGLLGRMVQAALLSSGDLDAAWDALRARKRVQPAVWEGELQLRVLARDYDGALDVLERERPRSFYRQYGDLPIELVFGQIYRLAGAESIARDAYREAVPGLEALIRSRPNEPWYHGWLAVALAGAGERESALAEVDLTQNLAELESDAWENPHMATTVLLPAYIMAGEQEQAIELIGHLLESQYYVAISRAWIDLDPRFDPLRSDARFQAIMTGKTEGPGAPRS